uniref:Tripartite motif-containing protein 65-like n=1 Tax=Cyprinus carpio TaxID=7962 RepID=A0A8C1ZG87_CYPCA
MDDHMQCTICLDLFNCPVTIPCGHTFCKACISKFWDGMGKDFHCPFCKNSFNTRPELNRNVSLSMITEMPASHSPAETDVSAGASVHTEPEQICERHQKPLVIFCRNDGMCVCYECSVNECKGHDKILVEEEWKNRETGLKKKCAELKKQQESAERNRLELTENMEKAKVSLQQTAQWVNTKFSQLIKVLVEKQEVTQLFLEEHQEVTLLQAQERLAVLEERAMQLAALQEEISSLCSLPPCQLIKDSRFIGSVSRFSDVPVDVHVSVQEKLTPITDVLSRVSKLVCEDLERAVQVSGGQEKEGEDFTHGQHYWELEVSKPWAYVGVTYPNIPRKEKGKRCMVGMNELSWSLQLDERQLTAWHAGCKESVAGQLQPNAQPLRIGMLLDYEAGTLTYYAEGQVRLHAFHCAFTQALLPACWIGEGVTVTLCEP